MDDHTLLVQFLMSILRIEVLTYRNVIFKTDLPQLYSYFPIPTCLLFV